jgi:hypothetical protein
MPSGFFKVAKQLIGQQDLPDKVSSQVISFQYTNIDPVKTPLLDHFRDTNSKTQLIRPKALVATLELDNFPIKEKPRIIALGTEEALAMFAGRWKVPEKGKIYFIPPRLDTGAPARIDIRELTKQLVQTPEFINLMSPFEKIRQRVFITEIIRDPCIELLDAVYLLTKGKNVNGTQIHIRHEDDNTLKPFGRFAAVCDLNLEGIDAENCEVIVICDPFASGMQVFKAMEVLLKRYQKEAMAITCQNIWLSLLPSPPCLVLLLFPWVLLN